MHDYVVTSYGLKSSKLCEALQRNVLIILVSEEYKQKTSYDLLIDNNNITYSSFNMSKSSNIIIK